ncbi:hypothetical protein [Pseudomonas sp. RIT-PI-AD]|uniref:hypothetical protein n=1 Tax=Pseudomonas sp. RIT-PI-AD TaxID=3035294 RepID=UPI0021DAB3F8|nr:hypothetical protein [Pseudomonas sp. RIT-PI-AD]
MHGLEEEYPGDRHWLEFVALYKADYLDENAYRLATIMNGRLDEAVIVYGKRGLVEAKWWIDREVPAL